MHKKRSMVTKIQNVLSSCEARIRNLTWFLYLEGA